jgi:hypothetical protein
VNQRGKASYTTPGYTIDRWRFWESGGSVSIETGYISHELTLLQEIDTKTINPQKTYTCAICKKDGTKIVSSGVPNSGFGVWNGVWVQKISEVVEF